MVLNDLVMLSSIVNICTRGTHYVLQPRQSNNITTLFFTLHQFHNTCDNKFYFIP